MGTDDLRNLAADLSKGLNAGKVRETLKDSATAVRKQLRSEAGQSKHFRLARYITVEESETFAGPSADIGPEKRGAGNLANIAYFGGAHGGGGTLPDPRQALESEAPRFVDALARLAEQITK